MELQGGAGAGKPGGLGKEPDLQGNKEAQVNQLLREKLGKDQEHLLREGRNASSWERKGSGKGAVGKGCFWGWGMEERCEVRQF